MVSALEMMDPETFGAMEKETTRQGDELELIASKNYVSAAVMEAAGGTMTNKYAAVYFALLEPGDTILGTNLSHGGHLTHGHPVTFSGRWFNGHL